MTKFSILSDQFYVLEEWITIDWVHKRGKNCLTSKHILFHHKYSHAEALHASTMSFAIEDP